MADALHNDLAWLHGFAVVASLLIYVVLSRDDHQRRMPSAAIAWVVSLATFPYIALPLYLVFGARKVLRGNQTNVWPSEPVSTHSPAWLSNALQGLGTPPCRANASIRLSGEGPESLEDFLQVLNAAYQTIDLSIFIFELDAAGNRVFAALRAAVLRGVRVRLLLDQVGNWNHRGSLQSTLQGSGIEWTWFNRVTLASLVGRGNLRSHRKYAIIDGHVFWSGGRNLGNAYFETSQNGGWDDLTFVIEGPIAADASALFNLDWGDPHAHIRTPVQCNGDRSAQLLPSGPGFKCDTTHDLLVTAIQRADHRVLAATPYFVPTDVLQQALLSASRRGVQVTLVVPAQSNHPLADIARARALRELADSGAHIVLLPGMFHAKAVVIDDILATCGSTNLDSRSLYLNYELNTVFYEAEEINFLCNYILGLANRSTMYTAHEPGWLRDMLEGVVRSVAFQL